MLIAFCFYLLVEGNILKKESIKLFLKAAKNTNLIIPNNILEPCCGIGSISKILKENGYSVYSSDLIDRGYGEETGIDFFKN